MEAVCRRQGLNSYSLQWTDRRDSPQGRDGQPHLWSILWWNIFCANRTCTIGTEYIPHSFVGIAVFAFEYSFPDTENGRFDHVIISPVLDTAVLMRGAWIGRAHV